MSALNTTYRKPSLLLTAVFVAAVGALFTACHHIDNDRIPPTPVYIAFQSVGEWERYGVAGATDSKRFIKSDRVPEGYPYAALTETGYGGVLLVSDLMGECLAYDLSCPVEARPNIRIDVNYENNLAVCPKCGSVYDVFSNFGTPVRGPAAERGYGLTRYHVSAPMPSSIPYRVITR